MRALLWLLPACRRCTHPPARKRNIIFIYAYDAGLWGFRLSWRQGLETPNLVFRCTGDGIEIDDVKVWKPKQP